MITWNPGSELEILKGFLGFQSLGKIQVTVWEPNSENFLDLNVAAPFLRNLSLYQIQIILYLQSENSCWIYQVLVASKIYAF